MRGFPCIAISTTAGTGSEITRSSVVTDEEKHLKRAIISEQLLPVISVGGRRADGGTAPHITASTGMDALTHAVEAYITKNAFPTTDACALYAIELIYEHLEVAYREPTNIVAREGMAYAQVLAGMAFGSAGLGLVHAMAHQLGALYDLPHGLCNAILLPVVEEFNRPVAVKRLARVASVMGDPYYENTRKNYKLNEEEASKAAVTALRLLAEKVNIPKGLSGLKGFDEKDIPKLALMAMNDGNSQVNPRPCTASDVEELFRKAL